ncbi:succinate dehydrogenase cytochrome b subunit [Gelidibacter sp.]|uniref:succinate dehydrogenase cytochrome b subunit n=1 Tax=Gelidibacter sp. TaxID=2018083 RepID=UPI002BF6ECCB|nr:succinate dehydrogenase cytochrome b subunit [Gelidibacter sp.]HUH28525.1 succinate dehydrogenase cytochrome b subunit [Gelidibacter sp.]
MGGIFNSSVGRKFAMALSAFFLMIFLVQHFAINILSVLSADVFNDASHFMGTNWVVQYIAQPILILGVIFHFVMGMVLEIRNRNARSIGYVKYNGNANSTWMSRNMIYTGAVILLFLGLHFYDFWLPEIEIKFIDGDMSGLLANGEYRYYEHLQHKFVDVWRVALYCLAFVFLSLHLLHGFSSAFQSVGANNKYTRGLRGFGKAYAIIIPLGFIFIALYHHFN